MLKEEAVLSLQVDEVLYHEKSKFQDILVFKSKNQGRVLVLDNFIQLTEYDEFAYHEMMVFLALNSHPNPKKVLVIGGGDGGVVREVVKHPSVESVVMCEIDEMVTQASKKYLPFMSTGFDSPKLKLHIGDGIEFMKNTHGEFDVIFTDSSDPIGPAVCLFKKPYYETMKKALKPGGILCSQGESMWYDRKLISEMIQMCRTLFPVVDYAYASIPQFPGGTLGFLLCSTSQNTNFREPLTKFSSQIMKSYNLRYYNQEVHRAAFVLPELFCKEFGLRGDK
ncbi:hypothetical protein JTE90_018988 [Oedothorax gibbosus]|uniref:PABS domain-containing protein n=1 Tax=Oedothorax gibbosus TaxID=931172 RepID=A0AAV6U2E6_9ARAC|nr:hypothetical protein JTE90_018988 [Oedothorax gibbosus]